MKRYLNCKFLDAGMDGMLCSMCLYTTCKEFNGKKCSHYTPNEGTPKVLEEFIKEVKKFGQKKASRLSGVPFETINNWCTGECVPRLDKAQKVANAIGLEFLLFEKE